MISQYTPQRSDLVLESDLAGEFPLYLYWPRDQSTLLYSTSITALLNDARVPKPLKVCNDGLSFLLQSGVVPPPKTAYEDIYIIGIGDKAQVSTQNGKVQLSFTHHFPFMNANRLPAEAMQPDDNLILQMLAEATITRIDPSKPSFLFHSAGKDSNSIALALAEAGWQDKVALITHKSKGKADESAISAKIAKKLGFKHEVLFEVDHLQAEHHQAIENYFINAPFPCTDNVTLAYPLYVHQLPVLKGANIIDGMGNDVFIGHIPSRSEYKRQKLSKYLKLSRVLSKHFPSESLVQAAGRTRAEWTGLSGLSYFDAKRFLPEAFDVFDYWVTKDKKQDYLDFRSSIRGVILDQEVFTRKVRNFSDSVGGNMVLPWANQHVSEYFAKMPEVYLFDRKALKNKLVLRRILKDRIGLDSDLIGKKGWTYDHTGLVMLNFAYIFNTISECSLWSLDGVEDLKRRLKNMPSSDARKSIILRGMIYRIFLISMFLNLNKYLR